MTDLEAENVITALGGIGIGTVWVFARDFTTTYRITVTGVEDGRVLFDCHFTRYGKCEHELLMDLFMRDYKPVIS